MAMSPERLLEGAPRRIKRLLRKQLGPQYLNEMREAKELALESLCPGLSEKQPENPMTLKDLRKGMDEQHPGGFKDGPQKS